MDAEAKKRAGMPKAQAMEIAAKSKDKETRKAYRIGITYAYMNDDNRVPPAKMAELAKHACENPE
ncbi:MAG TPA: hypothetical protein VN039_05715 [Nitrospira sp.]|nr:hypothetical protein [Nitrospira sp.]